MRAQRKSQIEDGVFSETFYLNPATTRDVIKGIYDDSYLTEDDDQGNVRQQKRKPRVLVDTIPATVVFRSTQIEVRGVVYTIQKGDRDDEGIPRMWLL